LQYAKTNSSSTGDARHGSHYSALCGMAVGGGDGGTPRRRKEKTFQALLLQLEALARQRPVLMVFEDVHWIDPSSRELLDLVGQTYARARALCERLDRPPEIVPVLYGQFVYHLLKGPLRLARTLAAGRRAELIICAILPRLMAASRWATLRAPTSKAACKPCRREPARL
jgi:hypothetical protein